MDSLNKLLGQSCINSVKTEMLDIYKMSSYPNIILVSYY